MAAFKIETLLVYYLSLSILNVVESSMGPGLDYVVCASDDDCKDERNTRCLDSICDCVEGAIKLSDNQCLDGEFMPPPRKVGKAEAADQPLFVNGRLPNNSIPDWTLYGSIFLGFVGMTLIGYAVAKRSQEKREAERGYPSLDIDQEGGPEAMTSKVSYPTAVKSYSVPVVGEVGAEPIGNRIEKF